MNDIYNKPDKAGEKQQLRSRLALLNDEHRRLKKEQLQVLAEITIISAKLGEFKYEL